MIKKYFQEITGHSYFLHHHGQIKKQLIVVVLKLSCTSESLSNLYKSQIASPIPFLIQEVCVHKNFHFDKFPDNGSDVASLWIIFLVPLPYRLSCDNHQLNQLKQQSDEAQS